jgi:parallel beta-helix repeat protein
MLVMYRRTSWMFFAAGLVFGGGGAPSNAAERDFSPQPSERQLPYSMHSAMEELPRITVGRKDADLIGTDHCVLQAAVDYMGALGGGTVEVGEGEFLMRDSLHLRSNVVVRGQGDKTILRKAACSVSPLALDGDFGEEQITVEKAEGFRVGYGVAVWDDRSSGGFHTSVARITGRTGNTFSIDRPLMADCMLPNNAQAATVFPVVSGRDIEHAVIENLLVDGNKAQNVRLNGCRGAGIYLYRGHGTVIRNCTVKNFNGDGISFQQSNDVTVEACRCIGNTFLGLHPGSGSQRPIVRGCVAQDNGTDGLFLCWRVRHGVFEDNTLQGNGRYGISIGHKDSDNLLQRNQVLANAREGIYFRNELLGMGPHRNRLVENVIENNGVKERSPGIRIRGATNGLTFEKNIIRDTRTGDEVTQTVGI